MKPATRMNQTKIRKGKGPSNRKSVKIPLFLWISVLLIGVFQEKINVKIYCLFEIGIFSLNFFSRRKRRIWDRSAASLEQRAGFVVPQQIIFVSWY
jgi:hypothetical protein